jgi:hypothetical protein
MLRHALAEEAELSGWVAAGLPPDRASLESAVAMRTCRRPALLLDPTGLAGRWRTCASSPSPAPRMPPGRARGRAVRPGPRAARERGARCGAGGGGNGVHALASSVGDFLDDRGAVKAAKAAPPGRWRRRSGGAAVAVRARLATRAAALYRGHADVEQLRPAASAGFDGLATALGRAVDAALPAGGSGPGLGPNN